MLRAFAASLLLSIPAAGTAQVREQPIGEIAADLAYGFCPLFLAGQFSLTGPELEQRGFGKKIARQPHPRIGEMSLVEAKLADGQIEFGGAAGKACTVVVHTTRSTRAMVLAKLRSNMAYMGLDFKTAASPGPSVAMPAGSTVETFRAPVEKQFLYLQHIHMPDPAGVVVAQLFATDK